MQQKKIAVFWRQSVGLHMCCIASSSYEGAGGAGGGGFYSFLTGILFLFYFVGLFDCSGKWRQLYVKKKPKFWSHTEGREEMDIPEGSETSFVVQKKYNGDGSFFKNFTWCYRSAVGDMSTTCQYRGGVSFSPVNLVSRTCQYGPFREHHHMFHFLLSEKPSLRLWDSTKSKSKSKKKQKKKKHLHSSSILFLFFKDVVCTRGTFIRQLLFFIFLFCEKLYFVLRGSFLLF